MHRKPFTSVALAVLALAGPAADGAVTTAPTTAPVGGKQLTLDLGNGVTMKFVRIEPGEFVMGSPPGEKGRSDDEGPPHNVKISKAFYLGVTEVTQAQWKAVLGDEPWVGAVQPPSRRGPDFAASAVSWLEASKFAERLQAKSRRRVRLPTEAEWEYACRAGATTRLFYSEDPDYVDLGRYAWCYQTAVSSGVTPWGFNPVQEVAKKAPNPWGLYDVYGNVMEWCADWYGKYEAGETVDPKGPASGGHRVARGGSWTPGPGQCRSASRQHDSPGSVCAVYGVRVAADAE